MIVGISPEFDVEDEHITIHRLLYGGMDLFHIRKYRYSDEWLKNYVYKVDRELRCKLVLHSHFHLANELRIRRLHCSEKKGAANMQYYEGDFILSTSVHSIEDFNKLSDKWKYAFLSPMFPSISKKGYGKEHSVIVELDQRENYSVRLIALGGIHGENYRHIRERGADGAGLLGSIWQSSQTLDIVKKCKEIDQLY